MVVSSHVTMLVFHGKLMGARKGDGGDSLKSTSEAQSYALKSLSNQEKLILVELQRTRYEIVNQLSRIDPHVFKTTENWFEVKQTIESYKRKITAESAEDPNTFTNSHFLSVATPIREQSTRKSSDSRHLPASVCYGAQRLRSQSGKARTSRRSLPKLIPGGGNPCVDRLPPRSIMASSEIRTGIDMLPVMTTTGSIALETGNYRQEKLKLPVFKLPTLDLTTYHRSHNEGSIPYIKSESLSPLSVAISIEREGGKYKNRTDFFRAIKIMRKLMRIEEIECMKSFLEISDRDIRNAEVDIQLYLFLNFGISDEIGEDSGLNIEKKEIQPNLVTVFFRAKQIASLKVKSEVFRKTFVSTNLLENDITDEEYTLDTDDNRNTEERYFSKSLPFSGRKNHKKNSERFHTMTNESDRTDCVCHSTKRKLRGIPSSNKCLSSTLKVDLIKSLSSMQHHSEMVKDDMLAIFKLTNIKDSNLRLYVLAMAARRMYDALKCLLRKDLRRGWTAWVLEMQQMERKRILDAYVRFHGMRYLSKALRKLLIIAMKKKWSVWLHRTLEEKRRRQGEKELAAAVAIQRTARGLIARGKVQYMIDSSKYSSIRSATVYLQKIFRGKRTFWKYRKYRLATSQAEATLLIQTHYRRHIAAKRVYLLRHAHSRITAATKICATVRMVKAMRRVRNLLLMKLQVASSVKIQSLLRGFLGKCLVRHKKNDLQRFFACRFIQKHMRGKLCRMHLAVKRMQYITLRASQMRCAILIQKSYRGYRGRIKNRAQIVEIKRRRRIIFQAASRIINMCRCFISRLRVKRRIQQRLVAWIESARKWEELWSEESNAWFYANAETGDSYWEPTTEGYKKSDGQLVLTSGALIKDPLTLPVEEDEERFPKDICTECSERYAIRSCKECGDNYCTPCFKSSHGAGTRRNHSYTLIGPIDCTECEMQLAVRWCVTCDESHCDLCWRKLHSKSKRRFHPFCKVYPGGRIGIKMTTIDGEEVSPSGYEPSYAQLRMEGASEAELAEPPEVWLTALDSEGNTYWYSTSTGVSQYENPGPAELEYDPSDVQDYSY